MATLFEELDSLPVIDDLLFGWGFGEYLLGSAGEPWAKFPWAAYAGYRENGYGWYGRFNFAGAEAGARRTAPTLPAVSGAKGVAATVHLRQAEGELGAYFELWLYAGVGKKSGWRLAAYPEGEETEDYELRLEFWYGGESIGAFGAAETGVHIPSEFSEGPTTVGLVVTGYQVMAVVGNTETKEWTEYCVFEEAIGYDAGTLTNEYLRALEGGIYLGIGGKNIAESYDPVLSNLRYGEVSLVEEVGPVKTFIALQKASGVAATSLKLSAPTRIALSPAAGTSATTMKLNAPSRIALNSAAGSSATALQLTVPVSVALNAATGTSGTALALHSPVQLQLQPAAGSSGTALKLNAPSRVALNAATGVATTSLTELHVPIEPHYSVKRAGAWFRL